MNITIEINQLTKIFNRGRLAISELSTIIDAGKISAFVGKNGSGKSTSIKCLVGLCHQTSGTITINGERREVFVKHHGPEVGFLPERIVLPNNVSVRDIILSIGLCRGMQRRECTDRMNELADYFCLDLSHKIKPSQSSNGMTQKAGVILSIIHNPSLIVLDEPTNALDPVAKNRLFKLLIQYKDEGKTILMATHHLDELDFFADDVLIFDQNVFLGKRAVQDLRISDHKTVIFLLNQATEDEIELMRAKNRQIRFTAPDTVQIDSENEYDVASVIQALSLSGLLVKSIVKSTQSLEQSYLDIIEHYANGDIR